MPGIPFWPPFPHFLRTGKWCRLPRCHKPTYHHQAQAYSLLASCVLSCWLIIPGFEFLIYLPLANPYNIYQANHQLRLNSYRTDDSQMTSKSSESWRADVRGEPLRAFPPVLHRRLALTKILILGLKKLVNLKLFDRFAIGSQLAQTSHISPRQKARHTPCYRSIAGAACGFWAAKLCKRKL